MQLNTLGGIVHKDVTDSGANRASRAIAPIITSQCPESNTAGKSRPNVVGDGLLGVNVSL